MPKSAKGEGMKLTIITLFPEMFNGPLTESLLKRAREKGIITIRFINPRDFTRDRHKTVDDRPYGGGPGMVLMPDPLYQALRAAGVRKNARSTTTPYVIYLSPQGRVFKQGDAKRLAAKKHVVLLCGHYEGVDERIMDWVHEELSIGDYVLTGGEIPAMAVIDAVARHLPGVVKEAESVARESFSESLLDYPHYTRPAVWRRKQVPKVLLSGHHKEIEAWRKEAALSATKRKRPDLLKGNGREQI